MLMLTIMLSNSQGKKMGKRRNMLIKTIIRGQRGKQNEKRTFDKAIPRVAAVFNQQLKILNIMQIYFKYLIYRSIAFWKTY